MPADKFEKVQKGDRPSAAAWNDFLEMLRAYKRGLLSVDGPGKGGGLQPGEAWIQNNTGDGVDRFSIIGLGDPLWTGADDLEAFQTDIIFDGQLPDALPDCLHAANFRGHSGKFGIALTPIPEGEIGRCIVAGGMTPVKLDVDDHTLSYDFAEPISQNASKLCAGYSGSARILWRPAASGDVWGLVALDGREGFAVRWATFAGSGTWAKGDTLEMMLLDDDGIGVTAGGSPVTAIAVNDFLDVEFDSTKVALLHGRKRSLALIAVDPCAPE